MERKFFFGLNIRSTEDKGLVFVLSASFLEGRVICPRVNYLFFKRRQLSALKIYSPSNGGTRAYGNCLVISRAVNSFLLSHTLRERAKFFSMIMTNTISCRQESKIHQ